MTVSRAVLIEFDLRVLVVTWSAIGCFFNSCVQPSFVNDTKLLDKLM